MESSIPRMIEPTKQSFFLFGPRGVGKTTWIKANYPDAFFIDLLEADTFRNYSAHPERLREIVLADPRLKTIVIDEIQKIPQLLPEAHGLIERKLGKQFILTGSSSRKLKRVGVDLLAGRALVHTLHPFMAIELKMLFDLGKALQIGLIPLIVQSQEPEKALKAYVSLYVREEVHLEGLVRNIGNFSRFLEAISFSHGSILNVSNVARECQVERKVVEAYIGILEDLLLAYRIPVFIKKAKRVPTQHPKFYFFDAGMFRALRPSGPLDKPGEIEGAALEGLIAQHLLAWNAYRGGKNQIYFWRTPSGTEVDFIVYGKDIFWAIEVKNSQKVRDEDLRVLKAFKTDYPQSKLFLIYRGKEKLLKDGISCIPCEDFLKSLS